ncbi:MAG: osmoprotectant transport system substrate-binding protein [Solirubrobacteraceae bacterium]|nr:osmoprotectant transport system substrate-binding protein [Solirubrobacteraceae bacterium]
MDGRRRVTLMALMAALVLALAAAGCGGDDGGGGGGGAATSTTTPSASEQPGKGKPPVTIGDKNFTEEFILGELYAQALRAKGWTVSLKSNIGSTEIIDRALRAGRIDMYPDYIGTILSVLAGRNEPPSSADATYRAAKRFEESRGFTLLERTPFFDTNAVGVLPDYAEKNGLKTIGDLGKLDSFTFADTPENLNRLQGVRGLREVYGLKNLEFKPLAIGLQYAALKRGDVQAADVFSTDAQLTQTKLVLLEDTKHIFGFQNVAPVVSQKVLEAQGPAFARTIDAVSGKLTIEAMRAMNAAVDIDKKQPREVARAFLEANELT